MNICLLYGLLICSNKVLFSQFSDLIQYLNTMPSTPFTILGIVYRAGRSTPPPTCQPVHLHDVFLCLINSLMFQPSFNPTVQPTITTSVFASAFTVARWEYKDNMDTETDGEDGEQRC